MPTHADMIQNNPITLLYLSWDLMEEIQRGKQDDPLSPELSLK